LEQRSAVFDFEVVAGEVLLRYSDGLESHSGGFTHLIACDDWNNALPFSLSNWWLGKFR
jgi:hypothetical protein